jgi:hypothetical protein
MVLEIIGYIGLIILVITVTLRGKTQRITWFFAATCLMIYGIYIKSVVFTLVNIWLMIVNLYYLITWKKK